MSWFLNPEGVAKKRDEAESLVPDPMNPNVMVSNKSANRPFLAYKEYRHEQEKKHEEWLARKRERDERLAEGEEVGPEEPDPTAEVEIGLWGIVKFLLGTLVIALLAGKFVTGSYLWEYDGKWVQAKTYFPAKQQLFSEQTLAQFDGSDPNKPLYIAIDGDVYDVSANRHTYGPGGSYHIFAGRDAARAYATGCFQTHLTHDVRELDDKELRGLVHWKKFFADHKTYFKVGTVKHVPIDPTSPIPEPCKSPKSGVGNPATSRKETNKEKEAKDKLIPRPVPKSGETAKDAVREEL